MFITVFVQNEAGSNRKNYHNENTLQYLSSKLVARPYPYPYGFIIGTTASDGCKLDCFVITDQPLAAGETVECKPVGLMEQIEDSKEDHNVLAVPLGSSAQITPEVEQILTQFVMSVFEDIPGKQMRVGRFLGASGAIAHIADCTEDSLSRR